MWQVIGQDRVISALERSREQGKLAHAYLVVGPPHVGKMTLALDLARAVNCGAAEPPCGRCPSCERITLGQHADVQVIGLDGSSVSGGPRAEIGIDRIREVQRAASLPPFEGRCRVFIIDGAERLSLEAANCLLKTLEEPAGNVLFVMLAQSETRLPATVVSRCQKLELARMAVADIAAVLHQRWGVDPVRAQRLARLGRGCLGWAVSAASDETLLKQRDERLERLLEVSNSDLEGRFSCAAELASEFSQDRESVRERLELWLYWWRDLLMVKIGCDEAIINTDRLAKLATMARAYTLVQIRDFIGSIRAAGEQLQRNASPRLVLETMLLDMPGGK